MWYYIFLLLRRQPGRSVLASSGFLLAACALLLLSATTQTTVVRANQLIDQNWHPTYDLVVLPSTVKLPPGDTVPADFLQSYDGGISVQQYAQITHLTGVQVAAPLAYIGYLSLPAPQISFPTQNFPAGYYQLTWTLTAFNGQRHLIEYQQSDVEQIFPCATLYDVRSLDLVLQEQEKDGCNFPTHQFRPILSFSPPNTGGFLLAAIDPEAENQLVHLSTSISAGRALTEQDTIHPDERIPEQSFNPQGQPFPTEAIPMLIHQQLPGQISLNMSLTPLLQGISSPQQLQQLGGAAYFATLPHQSPLFHGMVPMVQNDPGRFVNHRLAWDGQRWQTLPPSTDATTDNSAGYFLDFSSTATPAGLTYRPATAPNGEPAYTLVPTSTQGPEVGFRPLSPLHTLKKQFQDVGYTFEAVGQFTDARLAAQFSNPLNWLPENTYTALPITLRDDQQGHPVPPVTLLPTTNRAGYSMQPPLALTTLAAAEQLRGDHCISAIRIRVAGVEQASEQSWKRVQQVAGEITQRTHLQVIVTLGSSPHPTLVFVPGVKKGQFGATQDIEPVGWVEERWIATGVSVLYLQQLGTTRLLLLGAILAMCLGYLALSFSALVTAQRREFAMLSALGWRPWQPALLVLSQALALSLAGGIVGIGLALISTYLIGTSPPWEVVAWALPVVLCLALLSTLYPLWQIWHIRPAEILRAGTSVSSERASWLGVCVSRFLPAIISMALRNLVRSRIRVLIAGGCFFFSTALLTVMIDGLLTLRQTLQGSLLGNDVLLQTAVPQIAGAVFAVLLTFFSIADVLLLQVQERQGEIGLLRAVGWRSGIVQRLFLQEGLTLAMIGAIPGVLVALGILTEQHQVQGTVPVPLLALAAVLFMIIVAVLATFPALRAANRVQVVDVLRIE
ncbi:MAG: ABC transporter permease [Ktedonobacteraceae bacterium]